MSARPPLGDDGWDDERLTAALRTRSDTAQRPVPSDLIEETLARVRRLEPRRPWFAGRGLVGVATVANALLYPRLSGATSGWVWVSAAALLPATGAVVRLARA